MIDYKFCPQCRFRLENYGKHPYCKKCKIYIYLDPKPTACALITKNRKLLVTIRGIDPYKGSYDIPGGFLELKEHPKDAAIRETKEETGLNIKIIKLLSVYTDRYGTDGDYQVNFYYLAKVIGGKLKAQDDVSKVKWVAIDKTPKMGFSSVQKAVNDLKKHYKTLKRKL